MAARTLGEKAEPDHRSRSRRREEQPSPPARYLPRTPLFQHDPHMPDASNAPPATAPARTPTAAHNGEGDPGIVAKSTATHVSQTHDRQSGEGLPACKHCESRLVAQDQELQYQKRAEDEPAPGRAGCRLRVRN